MHEKPDAVTAVILGKVHGDIGMPGKSHLVAAVVGLDGNTDAG